MTRVALLTRQLFPCVDEDDSPIRCGTFAPRAMQVPQNDREREHLIAAAFADDEGFQILGEELSTTALDLVDYGMRPLGSLDYRPLHGRPRNATLAIRLYAGDRTQLSARDLDRIQNNMVEEIRRTFRRYNARPDRHRGRWSWQPRAEAFREGRRDGWNLFVAVVAHG